MKMKQQQTIQIETSSKGLSQRVGTLCAQAKQLEEAGKFADARVVLHDFWQRIGDRPKLDGLDDPAKAELLLRVGTLSGWLGSAGQIPGAQEIAKDLLSESANLFDKLNLQEKVAEAHVDLGICYWREGAFDEARITYDAALERLGELESPQRLRALLNKALVEEVSSRSEAALQILSQAEPLFQASSNHALKGKFHNEFGTVLKNAGLAARREDYIDQSLMQYTAAGLELEQAGDLRALGNVENNLGFLYAHFGRFVEAHEHVDRAISMATRSGDKGSRAQFEDTRARVFITQGLLDQAEKAATSAVRWFREGDEQANLAAALITHATILSRSGRQADALQLFNEAVTVAERAGDRESAGVAALTITEELGTTLSRADLLTHYQNAETALHKSQSAAVQFRLGECARKLLANEASGSQETSAVPPEANASNSSLEEQVLRYEAELIKRALDASAGSVTRAARLLGVTHQGLAFILNGRHKNLLSSRRPAKPRRRSIIRYH